MKKTRFINQLVSQPPDGLARVLQPGNAHSEPTAENTHKIHIFQHLIFLAHSLP